MVGEILICAIFNELGGLLGPSVEASASWMKVFLASSQKSRRQVCKDFKISSTWSQLPQLSNWVAAISARRLRSPWRRRVHSMKIPSTANYLNQTRENLRKNPFVAQKFRSTAMKRDFALVPGNSEKFKLRGAQTIIRGFLRGRMFSWKLLKEHFMVSPQTLMRKMFRATLKSHKFRPDCDARECKWS